MDWFSLFWKLKPKIPLNGGQKLLKTSLRGYIKVLKIIKWFYFPVSYKMEFDAAFVKDLICFGPVVVE